MPSETINLAKPPDPAFGLTSAEARLRLERNGPNALPQTESRRFHRIVTEIIREPMVALLLGCGAIYFVLGDSQEASLLLGFLLLIVGITVYQERKAELALESLRDLSSPRALVVREGRKERIPGSQVVVEDIIILNEGDRIPADATILSAHNLSVDESLLTGESVPVLKAIQSTKESWEIYAGTTIVKGSGVGVVSATGISSKLGQIGTALKQTQLEPTHLQRETRRIVKVVAILAAALCVLVAAVFALSRHDFLGGLLASLTLAMAILPNELPAVLTIFLALGAWRLSQRRVLTRRSPVVEALGAATVLCVDKTGTLTYNRMALAKLWTPSGEFDLRDGKGEPLPEAFHEIIEYGILAGERDPMDPMEKAFQQVGNDLLADTEHLHPDWTLMQQYPLSPKLLALSHAWREREASAHLPIAAKGAPEAIIDLCHLEPSAAKSIGDAVERLADSGLRVLGVAKARFKSKELPSEQHDFDFEFLGLVGLQDPIRREVPQAVAECYAAGIRVFMITGDHPQTAKSIASEIGLANPDSVLTGKELNTLSDKDLAERVSITNVYARMAPEQKLRLIEALKQNGEVVAMTGDGVNDAPALRSAHIGIAMGARGTDVAREAASLVLLDDDFNSIVVAVRLGRRIYDNLKRAMGYLLAVHIPITGISVIPVFFNSPLVLLPVHIAFLHLIIEPVCSIAFEAEPEALNVMERPPRPLGAKLFSGELFLSAVWMGTGLLVVLLVVYGTILFRGMGELDARTLTFTTLVMANLGLIASLRTRHRKGKNRFFILASAGSVSLLALVLFVPALRSLFHFSQLHAVDFAIAAAATGVSSFSIWTARWLVSRKRQGTSRAA